MYILCCAYTESSVAVETAADNAQHSEVFKVNSEADSNYTTERAFYDKPRPYLCTLCDKHFISKEYLNVHQRSHYEEQYLCTECERRFSFKSSLVQHMNIHAGKYKCIECGKCCHSNYALTVHRQNHSGAKSFEGSSKQMTTSSDIVVQGKVHSKEKQYECRQCLECFTFPGQLRHHLLISHSEGIWHDIITY